jgi:hypothetical protein
MQPFNYRQQVVDPFQQAISSTMEGFRLGAGLRQIQEQRAEAQRVEEQRQRLQTEFAKLQQNPTPTWEDYESVAMLLPKDAAESLRKNFEVRSAEEQKQEKLFTGQVAAALSSPNAESRQIGIERLRRRAEAERNAGRENEAQAYEVHARIAETSPDGAKIVADEIITFGSSVFGKDWTESIVRGREAPVQMAKNVADAKKAAVQADFAFAKEIQNLNLSKAQIENYAAQQDIARQNVKINKLNADLKREENELKRQDLQQKLDQARVERDEKIQTKVAEANTVLGSVDAALNNADQILANWGKTKEGKVDPTKPNSVVRSATGTVEARLPTLFQSTQDFESLLASFESKAFLSQVDKMRGLGALTEREGGRLVNALGSLDLKQSPDQLGRTLLEIQRELLKAREQMQRKYGVQSAPDRPAGPGAAAPAQVPSAMGQATQRAVTPGAAPATPGMRSTDDILKELGVLR